MDRRQRMGLGGRCRRAMGRDVRGAARHLRRALRQRNPFRRDVLGPVLHFERGGALEPAAPGGAFRNRGRLLRAASAQPARGRMAGVGVSAGTEALPMDRVARRALPLPRHAERCAGAGARREVRAATLPAGPAPLGERRHRLRAPLPRDRDEGSRMGQPRPAARGRQRARGSTAGDVLGQELRQCSDRQDQAACRRSSGSRRRSCRAIAAGPAQVRTQPLRG